MLCLSLAAVIAILTEHDLKRCFELPFCYLCGKSFVAGDDTNRDHVPPSAIFAKPDRIQPLILPTHKACNESNANYDEQVGQLVSVLHTPPTSKRQLNRLAIKLFRNGSSPVPVAGVQIDLTKIVFRWLRGFHAAIYREHLPKVGGYIHHSMPSGDPNKGYEPISPVVYKYIEEIKKNRLAKKTDRLVCRNGKCRYECLWPTTDEGFRFCLFALDVYDWQQLGDTNTPARSCVGIYTPKTLPSTASLATKLDFPFPNTRPLDAFSD